MILSDKPGGAALRTRFAPSPTGLLHLGHAFSALSGWFRAREAGGSFRLRLEDIDPARCRPEFAHATQEDLAWLGLDWDGPVRVQSRHMGEYGAALQRLRDLGVLYPCFCSRADVQRELLQSASAPHAAPDGSLLYPGTCRGLDRGLVAERLARGSPHAWRLDMAASLARVDPATLRYEDAGATPGPRWRTCRPERFGDALLARRDVPASYHLCATHDDWAQGINFVVRGEDLRAATDLHRLLQALLGWTTPIYLHHHLLRDEAGQRLAKRDFSRTLRGIREFGTAPGEVRAGLGFT